MSNREIIPMGGNQLGETVGCYEECVLGLGAVEDVLTLGDEVGGRLEGEEAGLGFFSGDWVGIGGGDGLAGVECFAEGFYLG